jgi:hypothetical protein
MSVYFFLFNKETKECLCLGKKRERDGVMYQGPSVFVDGDNYFLPNDYLELLIERFNGKKDNDNVIILPDYELFDTEDYVSESEDLVEIGGESYGDLPITKYFPELGQDAVKEDIKRRGEIIR